MYTSQRFSPNKSKQCKLFDRMLNFNLSAYRKQCNITLIYRSPSQSSEEFDTFLSNFELLLDYIANCNPFVSQFFDLALKSPIIIIGDFNAR